MEIRTARELALTVKGARLDRGWSQADLAKASGVSRKLVNELEGERAETRMANVFAVLDALELQLAAVPVVRSSKLDEVFDRLAPDA